MYCLNCAKIKVMLVGFVAAIVLFGGRAKADFTFGEATDLGPTINTSSGAGSPSFSNDSLVMYFDSENRPGGYGGFGIWGGFDIWVATRKTVDDDWGTPVNLGSPVNISGRDGCPCISSDGLTLYFDSIRPGGSGSNDLYVATRRSTSEPWSEPVNLGPQVNSAFMDYFPEVSPDGLLLYFESTRPGGSAEYTVWVTTRKTKDDPWGQPIDLGLGDAGSPNISSNGLVLFFCSIRPGGFGRLDMWVTRRANLSDAWATPVNLGPKVNTPHDDGYGRLSPDGSSLYVSCSGTVIAKIRQVPIIPIVDFNADGIVDIDDLAILIEHWGTSETLYDIGPMPWGDGVVDVADLEVLMRYWQQEILPPELAAYWKLDETEGNVAADSARDNDGTLSGEPLWQPEGGKVGGALQLDGVDDYLTTPFILNPADGPFSVFAWVKGGIPGQAIVSQIGGVDWLCADPSEGKLMTSLLPPPGRFVPQPLVSELVITDGNWHRIGFVWDGSHRRLCVDGVVAAEDTQDALAGSVNGLFIGCGKAMESGTFWSGLIDDVRIYNRAVKP